MKKFCIIFLLSFIIIVTAFGFSAPAGDLQTENYLRIHIRADSNESEAQAVKYLVRDELVHFLTPLVAEYATKEEAIKGVRGQISAIERVAKNTLAKNGFAYGARARFEKESFPTRVYGEYTLPAGEYLALVVELGSGKGDNWWCVVYPPLCFASPKGEQVIYKSKIAEIIKSWKNG
ncbi:MAG: stage II sporulation protein R [Clostridia bacterium]|nr:stage II sporulation protein R [Clostridia bacterium]